MKKIDGKEVINSPRTLRITVTPADVDKGTPMDPANCAIAQAVRRSLKGVEGVRVHRGCTYILRKGAKKWERLKTSSSARMETIVYDRGGRMELGEYDLLSPPPSMIVGSVLKKRSPSRPKTEREATLATRRRMIPSVRKTANEITSEGEKK